MPKKSTSRYNEKHYTLTKEYNRYLVVEPDENSTSGLSLFKFLPKISFSSKSRKKREEEKNKKYYEANKTKLKKEYRQAVNDLKKLENAYRKYNPKIIINGRMRQVPRFIKTFPRRFKNSMMRARMYLLKSTIKNLENNYPELQNEKEIPQPEQIKGEVNDIANSEKGEINNCENDCSHYDIKDIIKGLDRSNRDRSSTGKGYSEFLEKKLKEMHEKKQIEVCEEGNKRGLIKNIRAHQLDNGDLSPKRLEEIKDDLSGKKNKMGPAYSHIKQVIHDIDQQEIDELSRSSSTEKGYHPILKQKLEEMGTAKCKTIRPHTLDNGDLPKNFKSRLFKEKHDNPPTIEGDGSNHSIGQYK